jgi:tetratricopeptide (TPR) repeat protein
VSDLLRRGLLALAAICAIASSNGCSEDQVSPSDMRAISKKTRPRSQDHFAIALDFLKMRDKHNLEQSAIQASYHLNKWIADEAADPRWMIERRLINTLPDQIRRAEATKQVLSDKALAQLEFNMDDMVFLEESRWARAIATTVEQSPTDPTLQAWLQQTALPPKEAKKLAVSHALFDWTIRNIQLDELLEYPKTSAAGPVAGSLSDPTAGWPPPMRAVPGPGYAGYPWHVLMYGHGDAYQRSRVFMLLLRQLQIDAVMLGIDTKVGRAQPWLPAVLIDNQLYLFDPTLGLPIPGPQEKGIATLSQAIEDPTVLQALTLGENYVYWVEQEDLDKVVALIDAAPEALSQRMLLTEKRLSAADQMTLTVSLSELTDKVKQCQGITDVRLWAVPIEATIYQRTYAAVLQQDAELQRQEFMKNGVFQQHSPIVKGRRNYLLGRFNKEDDEAGAASHFAVARVTDASLESMEDSVTVQRSMGLKRPRGMQEEDWQFRLQQIKLLQVISKQHASYWMGLSHQQQGNYEAALNWLIKRTLDKSPEGPWVAGARYNIARCYEALGETQKAIELYRIDESPQRHGNLLRAKLLETRQAEATDAKAKPTGDQNQ